MAAELHNGAVGLFRLDNRTHVLSRERLEIKPVRCVEICGDRLRIIVDDNRLAPELLQRPRGVNRAVVKLNPLPDADRTGAEDNYAFLLPFMRLKKIKKFSCLILLIVRGVEIGSFRFELARAGVNHFEACVFSRNLLSGQTLDRGVEKSDFTGDGDSLLGPLIAEPVFPEVPLHDRKMSELVEEPPVDLRLLLNLIHFNAAVERFVDNERALVVFTFQSFTDLAVACQAVFFNGERVKAELNRTDGFHHGLLK